MCNPFSIIAKNNRTCGFFVAVILVSFFNLANGAIAKKDAAPATLAVVADFPKTAEQDSEIKVELSAKGGTAPYEFSVPTCGSGGTTCISVEGEPKKTYYVYGFSVDEALGDTTAKVHVKDAKGQEADTEFTVKVVAKTYTNKSIVDAVNGIKIPTPPDTTGQLAIANQHLGQIEANTKPQPQQGQSGLLTAADILLGMIVLFGAFRRGAVAWRNKSVLAFFTACLLIVVALVCAPFPSAIAATPTFSVTSLTPPQIDKGQAATVTVCGQGMKPSDVDDAKFEGLAVKPESADDGTGCFDFKFDAATSSNSGDFKLMIKSTLAGSFKDSGKVLKIVDSAATSPAPSAVEPAPATPAPATAPAPTTPPTPNFGAREDMRWKALFNAVCDTDPAKAKCGREFGIPITGSQLFAKLKKARNQAEENEVMAIFARASEFNASDQVFNDKRFTTAVAAMNAALQGTGNGVSEARAQAIAQSVYDTNIPNVTDKMELGFRQADAAIQKAQAQANLALELTQNIGDNVVSQLDEFAKGKKVSKPEAYDWRKRLNCLLARSKHESLPKWCGTDFNIKPLIADQQGQSLTNLETPHH